MPERRVAWDMREYLARVGRACFVCEIVADAHGYEHEVVHRDEAAIAFLSRYPVERGHILVAPLAHREHVIADFNIDEYLRLQQVVHRVGAALTAVVPMERLYVLSVGSHQGNRHVHWHLVPLPPGVPYEDQQTALFDEARGWLALEAEDAAALAQAVGRAMRTGD